MSKPSLIEKIKKIILEKDPNSIKSINCDFEGEFNYENLVKYWKTCKVEDELCKEFLNIKNFKSSHNIGVFSLFYFKDNTQFLALGKSEDSLLYFDIKCPQYQKVLSNAMSNDRELFVLSYWII